MSTEISTITAEALAKTELVLGEQNWIKRLQDQQSGMSLVLQMRHYVYPQIFKFLSTDTLYGFTPQKDIFEACLKTVIEGCLIGKFIRNEMRDYEKKHLPDFFSNLKNGTQKTPFFGQSDALNLLNTHLFYIAVGSSYPDEIKHALLTDQDRQYNWLAFQFEAQRLLLQIYPQWVSSNLSAILEHAQSYSDVVKASSVVTFETPAPTTLAQRVAAQRNPDSVTIGEDQKNNRGSQHSA